MRLTCSLYCLRQQGIKFLIILLDPDTRFVKRRLNSGIWFLLHEKQKAINYVIRMVVKSQACLGRAMPEA